MTRAEEVSQGSTEVHLQSNRTGPMLYNESQVLVVRTLKSLINI